MVTVCLTCGDRGFDKVMISCNKCQDSPQHVYCLDVTPEEYFEKRLTWVCDNCEIVPPKLCGLIDTAEVQNIHLEKRSPRSNQNKNCKKKKNGLKKKSVRKKCTESVANVQSREVVPPEHEADGSERYHSVEKITNGTREVVEDKVSSCHDVATSVKTCKIASCDPAIEENCKIAAQPIIDPSWRGSLSIMNKDFTIISGVVAHVSSLACAKVFEAAKLLPRQLFPDLVCRVDVWPKMFERCGTNDQSIALYFFPDNKRNEKDFDNLVVSMAEEDLAMRAVLDNTELLVFTSCLLPEQFQRFQTKFYLWGVFRGKQPSPFTKDNVPGGEKDLTKSLTGNPQSPVSPLSKSMDYGSRLIH